MSSSPAPHDPITRRTYEALCASMSEEFGTGNRVWADEETPLRWVVGSLDIDVQLFDRRDSQVMVSIEDRERSKRVEEAALQIRATAISEGCIIAVLFSGAAETALRKDMLELKRVCEGV